MAEDVQISDDGSLVDSSGKQLLTNPEARSRLADALSATFGHGAGLLSERPAASADNAGSLFFVTDVDGGTLYRSNGSSWVQVAAGVIYGADAPVPVNWSRFLGSAGTPSIAASSSNAPAWIMAKGDSVDAMLLPNELPAHWDAVHIDAFGYGVTESADVVRISLQHFAFGNGEAVNPTPTSHPPVDKAMPNVARGTVTARLATGMAVDTTKFLRLRFNRANHANDTYTDPFRFLGLVLTRAA